MTKRVNHELIDDDNPEWTAADFAGARPASEVLPELFGAGKHIHVDYAGGRIASGAAIESKFGWERL